MPITNLTKFSSEMVSVRSALSVGAPFETDGFLPGRSSKVHFSPSMSKTMSPWQINPASLVRTQLLHRSLPDKPFAPGLNTFEGLMATYAIVVTEHQGKHLAPMPYIVDLVLQQLRNLLLRIITRTAKISSSMYQNHVDQPSIS